MVAEWGQRNAEQHRHPTVGRLSRMTDHSGSTTYCYNRYGDLTRKVQQTQGKTFVLRWNPLPNGRLASMTYPNGAVVEYRYDSQGRTIGIDAVVEEWAASLQ